MQNHHWTKHRFLSQLIQKLFNIKYKSSDVDTLHNLGYGIWNTGTVFIEDKWAEWAESQSTIIASIIKPVPTTHVADNTAW